MKIYKDKPIVYLFITHKAINKLTKRSHELLRTNTADNNLDRFKYLSKADKKSKTMTQNKKNKIK